MNKTFYTIKLDGLRELFSPLFFDGVYNSFEEAKKGLEKLKNETLDIYTSSSTEERLEHSKEILASMSIIEIREVYKNL